MMLKLTLNNSSNFVYINYNNISGITLSPSGLTRIFTIGDSTPFTVKELPEEIVRQIEELKIIDLATERTFRHPEYYREIRDDIEKILSDIQRFKNSRKL